VADFPEQPAVFIPNKRPISAKYAQFIDKHYDNNNTYAQECIRLLQFLRRLPGADKRRTLPIDIPKVPKRKKYVQPSALRK